MATIPEGLVAALADRYRITRELGAGGMATVYLAEDLKHQRQVAVKVLRPDLAATLGAERFFREIAIAARLSHPHILGLHDSGEAAGFLYYVMPYVEGISLRQKLQREGELPVPEAVRILRDVADALAYAHRQQVVHRDIKPENVMLVERHALVMDFGVAKALAEGKEGGPSSLTSAGVALGTPAYMAPEQASGDLHVDHRADLYTWGVVAYELLAGQPPFVRATPQATLGAQVTATPEPVTHHRANIPGALAHLVMQCLEKKAADRPQSAEEVLRQLDQVLTPSGGLTPTDTRPYQTASARRARRKNLLTGTAVVAGLAVIGMLGWEWWQGRSTQFPPLVDSATEAGVHRIAVLPFENIGDSANTYFADGIADAVRGKLMGLAGIDVIARGSSLEYRGTDKRPNIIASELGVRYLLTGTVRFATVAGTQHVQVSPELVEIGDDGIPHGRWQEPYEAEVKDVFRVQGEIAQRVAEAMRLALADTVRARLVRAPTTDSAAYDFYLRALEVSRDVSRLDGATRAIALLEQAVARDSMMIEAWELASMIHSWIQTNWPTPQNDEAALVKAQRALALAPRGAAGHRALARYYQLREPAKALQEVELALRVEPDDIGSLTLRADAMLEVGIDSGDTTSEAFASSLRDGERVLRLDPRSAAAWSRQTRRLLHLRRVGDARLTATRTLALAPASLGAVRQRVLVELVAGDLDAARHVLTSARNDHDRTRLVAHMAEYYDLGWVLDTDDERLLLTLGPEAFGSPLSYALVRSQQYRWRGDTVRARAGWDSVGPQLAARAQTETGTLQMANNGLALAYAGQAREALAVVERAEAQLRSSGLPGYGYHWYMHARTALLAGDRTRAIELLRRVLRLPYFVTPAWLRIDPSWDALRGYPPFEELLKPKG